jgi:hypothetical protein
MCFAREAEGVLRRDAESVSVAHVAKSASVASAESASVAHEVEGVLHLDAKSVSEGGLLRDAKGVPVVRGAVEGVLRRDAKSVLVVREAEGVPEQDPEVVEASVIAVPAPHVCSRECATRDCPARVRTLFQRVTSEIEGRRDFDLSGCGDLFRHECFFETCRETGRRVHLDDDGVMESSVVGLVVILGMSLKSFRDALRNPQSACCEDPFNQQIQHWVSILCDKALPGLLGPEASRRCMRQ